MSIIIPAVDQSNLPWLPDRRSIEPFRYSGNVVVNENFQILTPRLTGTVQFANRGFNAIIDTTFATDTSFDYIADNKEELTYTIAKNGPFVLSCWGVTRMGAGILTLEWLL